MLSGTVDYPGDGTAEMGFTDMRDIAHFVFRALDLETWPEDLGMRGDVASYRDIGTLVEKVQGRTFLTKENSIESMEAGTEDPALRFYNQTRIKLVQGWAMIDADLNRAFPDMKPMSIAEIVEKWWSGVDVGTPAWGKDMSLDTEDL